MGHKKGSVPKEMKIFPILLNFGIPAPCCAVSVMRSSDTEKVLFDNIGTVQLKIQLTMNCCLYLII